MKLYSHGSGLHSGFTFSSPSSVIATGRTQFRVQSPVWSAVLLHGVPSAPLPQTDTGVQGSIFSAGSEPSLGATGVWPWFCLLTLVALRVPLSLWVLGVLSLPLRAGFSGPGEHPRWPHCSISAFEYRAASWSCGKMGSPYSLLLTACGCWFSGSEYIHSCYRCYF